MNDLKKQKILKRLEQNKNIIILKPNKGDGLDKVVYNNTMADLLSDDTKLQKLEYAGKVSYSDLCVNLRKPVSSNIDSA